MTALPAGACSSARVLPRSLILGFAFLALAVGLCSATIATLDQPTVAVIWGGLALAAYLAGLLCLIAERQRAGMGIASWKLGPWTLLWYGIAYGITTVTWSQPQTNTATQIALSSVLRALWIMAVGMTVWALGYWIGPGRPIKALAARPVRRLSDRYDFEVRGPAAPWILYGVGIAARLAAVASTGRFGYVGDISTITTSAGAYDGILGTLSLCAPLALAAAALQVFRERSRRARFTLAILFSIELIFGAAAGGKESFVIAVLAVVIPFSAERRRLPKAAMALLIIVFLVVVIPFNQAYRATARQGSATLTPREAVAVAPSILKQTVIANGALGAVLQSLDYLGVRVREIDGVAIIAQRVPGQIAFGDPVGLIVGPVAGMIPRALWPNKPIDATGVQFSHEFYGLPSITISASADTLVGGLYWDGGWLPVIVGMFVLGCAMRMLDDVLDARSNPHAAFFVLLFFPSLVGGALDWLAVVSAVPATLAVWLLAVVLTFRSRRRGGEQVPPKRFGFLGAEATVQRERLPQGQ